VVSGSLCFNNCVVVMSMVSAMGMLTYRSFMSNIINLCLLLMLSLSGLVLGLMNLLLCNGCLDLVVVVIYY